MNSNRRFILSMAALLAWMIIIFTLSHQNGSDTYETSIGLADLIDIFLPMVSIDFIHMALRKAAHIFLFAVLSMIAGVTSKLAGGRVHRAIRYMLLLCPYFLSWFDEYTKIFVNGRHYELKDVALNMVGCIAGTLILQVIRSVRNNHH